jgi:hypothetical protein
MATRIAALMVDILANTASVSTSVSKIEKDITGFGATATKALGMLGVAFGVNEVVGYGKANPPSSDAHQWKERC